MLLPEGRPKGLRWSKRLGEVGQRYNPAKFRGHLAVRSSAARAGAVCKLLVGSPPTQGGSFVWHCEQGSLAHQALQSLDRSQTSGGHRKGCVSALHVFPQPFCG